MATQPKAEYRGRCVTVLGLHPPYKLPSEAQGSMSQAPASRLSPHCGRTQARGRAHSGRPAPIFAELGARVNISHVEKYTFLHIKLKNVCKALTFIQLKVDKLLKMIEFTYYCTCLGVLLGSQCCLDE